MTNTHRVVFKIQHEAIADVWVSSPEAARAQALAYMKCFAPLGVWKDDTSPEINVSGASVKDADGFYLYDCFVWPKLPVSLLPKKV